MNPSLTTLLSHLTFGLRQEDEGEKSNDFIGTLAMVYEKARNALEYRADNLVRRAAIERILKRRILLNKDPERLTKKLLTELKWAKYLSIEDTHDGQKQKLENILDKYLSFIDGGVPNEWVVKIASAEIEDFFNLNTDYKQFTFFAYEFIRQRIKIEDENLDLITFFAVDKVYAGSDDEQIAYHLLKLAGENITQDTLTETWRLFNLAKNNKNLSRIIKFTRRQMPPLILLRDIYFYKPDDFKEIVFNENDFNDRARDVLDTQIDQLEDKTKTAGLRSIIYIFLTKMVFAFGLEVPLEILVYGRLDKLPLIVNLIFPPFIMWLATTQIRLPSPKERTELIIRSWSILSDLRLTTKDNGLTESPVDNRGKNPAWWLFSTLYLASFIGVFALIYYLLGLIGFTFFSKVIFIFFLCIIAFFAYRIIQITKVYSWKNSGQENSKFSDIVFIPILALGSRLSLGLSKLNFLILAFDFILEAPFKLILGFLDDWVNFLSVKKEEEIIE